MRILRQQRFSTRRAIIAYVTKRKRQEAQQESAVSTCNETVLGDVFHPLTGSNRALPSTAVRWRAGFASRITGQRLGEETWGSMKCRGLELG